MSYSEMINAYFDEGLDGPFEDVLFEKLAESVDLRREFNEHMRLHMIIHLDASATMPPIDVTQGLFSRLGPAMPMQTNAAAIPSQGKSVLPWRGFFRPSNIYTSMTTAALVITLFWFIRPFENTRIEYVTEKTPVPPALTQMETASAGAVLPSPAMPVPHAKRTVSNATMDAAALVPSRSEPVRQFETDPALIALLFANHAAVPDSVVQRTPRERKTLKIDTAPVIDDVSDMAVFHSPGMEETAVSVTQAMSMMPFSQFQAASQSDALQALLSGLILEMRVMNGRSNPSVNLPYSSANLFKDIAFSIAYKLDEKNALGFEYGRETFGQKYISYETVTDPLVDIVIGSPNEVTAPWMPKTYTRNMMLDWFGAVWQVSFKQFEMFSMMYPYMRSFVGVTKQGPIGKLRMGVEIAPTSYSMFNVGVEGTFLRYEVDKMWYHTSKFGITLGLAIGF